MRILVITAGSRGDVAPFTGLGQRLLDAGHSVAVAAHSSLASLVGGRGLDHRPLPGDPQELNRAKPARAAGPGEDFGQVSPVTQPMSGRGRRELMELTARPRRSSRWG
ncbi:glycosyltransferase [Streptomyces sp. NBC_01230]|nr:glycosyltransferase [Streptomyces sp. NBC_01230]